MFTVSFSFLIGMPPDFISLSLHVPEHGAGAGLTKQEAEVVSFVVCSPWKYFGMLETLSQLSQGTE